MIKTNELPSHKKTQEILKRPSLNERSQFDKVAYYMTPTTRCSGKGKTIETVKRWLVARGWGREGWIGGAQRTFRQRNESMCYCNADTCHYTFVKTPRMYTTESEGINDRGNWGWWMWGFKGTLLSAQFFCKPETAQKYSLFFFNIFIGV